MDIVRHNSAAWDRQVERGNEWTLPVDAAAIAAARRGETVVWLTDKTPVPADWFARVPGKDALCLASGGGQQAPLLAAAGYNVVSYDNSLRQLAQDRLVAEREALSIRTIQGDMADLSAFDDASFDLVFHPISNLFAPDVLPVWREAYRVLRPDGVLMAGFVNPMEFIFDYEPLLRGEFIAAHPLPYSDAATFTPDQLREWQENGNPLEYGHTLTDQIGGQLAAGFALTGFYEDKRMPRPGRERDIEAVISQYAPVYIATCAVKMQLP